MQFIKSRCSRDKINNQCNKFDRAKKREGTVGYHRIAALWQDSEFTQAFDGDNRVDHC
jgi:hypothetical protein